MRDVARQRPAVVVRRVEGAGHVQVHPAATRLAQRAVGGAPDEIVSEVVARASLGRVRRAKHPMPLELFDGGQQGWRGQRRQRAQGVDRKGMAQGRRPRQELGRAAVEASEALGDETLERVPRAPSVGVATIAELTSIAEGAGELEREERIASPVGEDLRSVRVAVDAVNERRRRLAVERRQLDPRQAAPAPKAPEERHDSRIGVDLGRPRGAGEEHRRPGERLGAGLRETAQESDRGLVEPLQVIERDHDGAARGALLEQAADRVEQSIAVGLVARGAELGQERRELRVERAVDRPLRQRAQGRDPGAVGSDHLGLERATDDRRPSARDRLFGDLREEPRLADARLTRQEEHAPGFAGRGCTQGLGDDRTLCAAADERRPCDRWDDDRPRREGLARRVGRRFPDREPRDFERPRRPPPDLNLQDAAAALVLLQGFARAAQPDEELDDRDVPRLGEGIDGHACPRVPQGVFGHRGQTLHQGRQDRRAHPSRGLALGDAPLVEAVALGQIEAFEQLASEHRGGPAKNFDRDLDRDLASVDRTADRGVDRRRGLRAEIVANGRSIDARAARYERHVLAVGREARGPNLVDERTQLRQAPSKRGARVARPVPE